MVTLESLVSHLNLLLQPEAFKDYCPNGLQVEGKTKVKTLVTGVTASQALIDAAIKHEADAILVHHGFFWKNEPATIVGMKQRRIQSLLVNDISLIAYHLPLDAHPVYGNNIQLGNLLALQQIETFAVEPGLNIGYLARLTKPATGEQLSTLLAQKLSRVPLHVAADKEIRQVAWCTGGAQDYITQAIEQGADAYITGEISERTFHIAQENNIHFYAAGHHATERYGVKSLGEHLADEFNLRHHFIDIDNPV